MLIVIDYYAENPIVGKTLQQCILEDSNIYDDIHGNGDANFKIINTDNLKIRSENYLQLEGQSGIQQTTPGTYWLTVSGDTEYAIVNNWYINDNLPSGSTTPFLNVWFGNPSYGSINPVTVYFQNETKVKIPGGSPGQVLTTDGSGNLSWTTVSGGGSVTDGDYGDITVSGSGSIWTIDNNVVTYGKMQQVTGHSVLGHIGNLTGNVEEITSTSNGDVLHRNGSNLVFATIGDSSITASSITYSRLQDTANASILLGRGSTSAGTLEEITLGSGLTMSGTTLSSSGSSPLNNPTAMVVKTVDETIVNSSTLQADDELFYSLIGGKTYNFQFVLFGSRGNISNNVEISFSLNSEADCGAWGPLGSQTTNAYNLSSRFQCFGWYSVAAPSNLPNIKKTNCLWGVASPVANCTLELLWAQSTTFVNTTPITVHKGSKLIIWELT